MTAPCVFMLPNAPSLNHLYEGTGRRKRKSASYMKWIVEAGLQLNAQKPLPIYDGPIEVTIFCSRRNRKTDLDNIASKAVLDLIKTDGHGHGIISDDSIVERITMAWDDSQTNGACVVITPMRPA